MFPLCTTFNSLVTFSIVTILISCSDRSKTDAEVIKALDESLVNSNKAIEGSISDVMTSLQDKLNDRSTAEKAQVWYPKAQLIQKVSKNAIDDIEKIKIGMDKEQKRIFDNDSMGLYEIIITYKKRLLQIDPKLTEAFETSIKLFTQSLDSAKENQKNLLEKYFDGTSFIAKKAMLSKLQNNIRLNEDQMLAFCHEHCIPLCRWTSISTLIVQDKSVVRPGEAIEISAGIAEFIAYIKPEVFVYGKLVPIKSDAIAAYKFKAASNSGKYYVPVKINYTDQNGARQSIQKKIEYTVANIQEQ